MPENNKASPSLSTAPELEWLDETIPLSLQFDDPYYSKNDGLSETRHVFINANHLPDRFENAETFTIAELGFGTGLNFIATAIDWQNHASPETRLEFISFEKFPLPPEAMRKALARWPQISAEAEKLTNAYDNALASGSKRLEIKWTENCRLEVLLGDASERLAREEFQVDAWFLDGFAPSKNPDLWSGDLMVEVFGHTVPGGTFATYTAAGWVRRNLVSAGFTVRRVPGHAGKREMMVGQKPR